MSKLKKELASASGRLRARRVVATVDAMTETAFLDNVFEDGVSVWDSEVYDDLGMIFSDDEKLDDIERGLNKAKRAFRKEINARVDELIDELLKEHGSFEDYFVARGLPFKFREGVDEASIRAGIRQWFIGRLGGMSASIG